MQSSINLKSVVVLAAALLVAAGAARAELKICNGTDARHSVAVGYKDGANWVSEGWWNIDPGDCARIAASRNAIVGDPERRCRRLPYGRIYRTNQTSGCP